MKKPDQIEHDGIVKSIQGNTLEVSINAKSACASCTLKSSCSVSDVEEKIVDVVIDKPKDYKTGELVKVFYKQSLGYRALLLGYLLPLIIVVFCLIVVLVITRNEILSGLTALGMLVPYYLILYISKDKIKKTFRFSVAKILNSNLIQTRNL